MPIHKMKLTVSTALMLLCLTLIVGCSGSADDATSSRDTPSGATDSDGDDSAGTQPTDPVTGDDTTPDDPASADEPAVTPDEPPVTLDVGGDDKKADNGGTRNVIPVQASCTVPQADFEKWFKGGAITKDGLVTPADSLQSLDTLCAFYQWSWRMFLWQVSETPDGLVFNTSPFYDLNDSNELVSNGGGKSRKMYVRGGKQEEVGRTGQAGVVSGVLMSQPGETHDGSIVYYAIHVNDVYAYMASGVNSNQLTGVENFPITVEERDAITEYAKTTYGVDIADADSLAMELKSSWVKASDVVDASNFITITADVPKYTQDSDQKWTWDGTSVETDVTLALVGYHVVGSAADHPEMIWATFEHQRNASDENYYYIDADGNVAEQKNWNDDGTPISAMSHLFTDGTSKKQSMNQMFMEMKGSDIVATPGHSISASNTIRTHPWGSSPKQSSAVNNTAIISINQNVTSMLADGDVRKNYFLAGATWTDNGVPGVGFQIPEVAGSLTLANATMETYFQFKNCFDCHNGGKLKGLSHIFGSIKPLPAP